MVGQSGVQRLTAARICARYPESDMNHARRFIPIMVDPEVYEAVSVRATLRGTSVRALASEFVAQGLAREREKGPTPKSRTPAK